MLDKKTIVNLIVAIVLITLGCIVGKLVMENVADTWIAFNGPALGIFGIGELIWWRISKRLFRD